MDEDLKAYLDGKFGDLDGKFADLDGRFAYLDGKFGDLDGRFAYLDGKFAELDGKFAEVDEKFAEVDRRFSALEERLVEQMRDMQTEILRGFEAFSAGQAIRLRKVEVDQSNLDSSLSARVNIVEARLLQIELRLGKL